MRILVTGGTGLVGGRIAKYLNSKGYEVIVGSRSKINNSSNSLKRIKYIQLNWQNKNNLIKSCDEIDIVIHAAGMNYNDCHINPVEALNVNGVNTANLLHSSIESNISFLVSVGNPII